jgi:hypothetical protein
VGGLLVLSYLLHTSQFVFKRSYCVEFIVSLFIFSYVVKGGAFSSRHSFILQDLSGSCINYLIVFLFRVVYSLQIYYDKSVQKILIPFYFIFF